MVAASDNAFPSILITEGTEPSAPAAGKQRLYIDSTTHKLKRTDSSGTDVTIEATATTPAFVGCSLYNSGNITIPTGAEAAIALNSENFDTDAFHDTVTNNNRITIPSGKGGKYLFNMSCRSATSTELSYLVLRKNAAADIVLIVGGANIATVGTITTYTGSVILDLVATDYIAFGGLSSGAHALQAQGAAAGPWLQCALIGT